MQIYAVLKKYTYFSTTINTKLFIFKIVGSHKPLILILHFLFIFLMNTEMGNKKIKNYYFDFYARNNN